MALEAAAPPLPACSWKLESRRSMSLARDSSGRRNTSSAISSRVREMPSAYDGMIGVSDHGGWAVLVTVAGDGTLLDRRRVELVDKDLPKIPHHSEGQALPLHEAVALVERVSAERHAKLGLDAVAMTVPG